MARRVLMAEVSGGPVRGRLRLGWMDGVKAALSNRGMTVEAARQCAKDPKVWRALAHILMPVCVCFICFDMTTPPWCIEKVVV